MRAHIYAGNNRKSVHLFTQPAAQSATITVPCSVALFKSETDSKVASSTY